MYQVSINNLVYFNEPISMLQRLCENFQYSELLKRAAYEKNQYIRLALIGAFNISGHALSPFRTLKFFNPLLMETYEYIDNDLEFRFYAEQVSHHPAISACYVEGNGYNFSTNSHSKSNFLLTKGALEFQNLGKSFVNLTNTEETFSYTRPKVIIRNLIMGTMYVDFYDTAIVTNHTTSDVLNIKFYEYGNPNSEDRGVVYGEIKDINKVVRLKMEGSWMDKIDIIYEGKRETIWTKFKTDTKENYYFTDFTSNLNNLTEEIKNVLPPTDCRLRPDQRALENHNVELASSEKHRLEEKQRKKRKEQEKHSKHHKHTPMYFEETYDDLTGDLIYKFNDKYWEDRKNKNYSHFPDIY